MSKVIGILILLGLFWGGKQLASRWERVKKETAAESAAGAPTGRQQQEQPAANALAGLPQNLEASLATARQRGAAGLKTWLDTYGPSCADPRRASIELDYALLLKNTNPPEAKKLYQSIKARTPATSPIATRLKQLSPAFE